MSKSKIEWTDRTWSPVTGCTKISPGCANCYAERIAKRLAGRCGYSENNPFTVTLHQERLGEPLRWTKAWKVFVCSMSDLFHPGVRSDFIEVIFGIMSLLGQHTFLVLTKRPEQMAGFFRNRTLSECQAQIPFFFDEDARLDSRIRDYKAINGDGKNRWPLPNVWLGVTAENQEEADKRIPILLQIPAAVRFVSVEPMLSTIYIKRLGVIECTKCRDGERWTNNVKPSVCYKCGHLQCINSKVDWVICGGESGPGARPMHPDWARSLRDQCVAAGTKFFFKQWGEYSPVYDGKTKYTNVSSGVGMDEPCPMYRVGKKKAGRLLDGREWSQMPGDTP